MNLDFRPVTAENWDDMERFFEARGGPHPCWCMVWRANEFRQSMPGKPGKKAAMKQRVDEGIPVGILAYSDGQPVGWCSVAPRETHRRLGGDESLDGVWSITCFVVARPFRRLGVQKQLRNAAIQHAIDSGAKYVEAYPVRPDSPSYGFMGRLPLFQEAGFEFQHMAGSRRHVMLLKLR